MESKRKLEEDCATEVLCYVHKVGESIRSTKTNTVYFNAVVQEKDDYKDLVVFSPEKRGRFLLAEESKSPVRLRDVRITTDRYRPSKKRVLFSNKSRIEDMSSKQLQFRHVEKLDVEIEKKTAQEIKESVADYEHVTMNAKVISMGDVEVQSMPDGRNVDRRTIQLADSTGSVELTAWDKTGDDLVDGQSYSFGNVVVRSFNYVKYLAMSKESVFKGIDDIENAIEVERHSLDSIVVGCVVHVKCTVQHFCGKCKNEIVDINFQAKSLLCPKCTFRMLTSRLVKSVLTKVNVEDASGKVTNFLLPRPVVEMLVCGDKMNSAADETTFIEESLLEIEEICICSKYGRVTSASISTEI